MQQTANYNTRNKKGKQKPAIDLTTMAYGKIPPQANDLEEAVLGAILLDRSAFDTAVEILKPECFYRPVHQTLFEVMLVMSQKSILIDLYTLIEELNKLGKLEETGGPYALSQLTNKVVSTANLETHCRIVLEKHIKRQLIQVGGQLVAEGYEDGDVFDTLDNAETAILEVSNVYLKKDFSHILNVGAKVINRIDALRNQPEKLSGITSGFDNLDRITYGWQPTDLIVLAARPSVGKTAFALNLARNAAKNGDGVGMFSLEMSAEQLVQRILSAESEVPLENINRGQMKDYEYKTLLGGITKFETMPIYIDDTAALNIFEFRAKARRMVRKYNVKMIIIDYLQLMSGESKGNGNREQEISKISRNLKALAKELNIPIIALSQLSRAVETRKESKVPQLSDLRESGAIEQDADMVMFIYRPEYYEQATNAMGESTAGETHIKIAKHRNGTLGTVYFNALLHIQKFTEKSGSSGPGPNWKPVKETVIDFSKGFESEEF